MNSRWLVIVLLASPLAACGTSAREEMGGAPAAADPEAGTLPSPGRDRDASPPVSPVVDASADAPRGLPDQDAATGDDGGDAAAPSPSPFPPDAGATTVTVYPPVGSGTDDPTAPKGPGLVLMGGGPDVDAAFVWAHDVIAGSAAAKMGDLVVLRATGDNAYDAYIAGLSRWSSVRTILLPPPSTPADLALTAWYVDHAEAVFFAGGNQADYVRWKGSALSAAVARVYARGGIVGGTSAGCAIQGPTVFDALSAGASNVTTADALKDPFEASISFTHDLFAWPTLGGVVTDPHFQNRDRLGRLTAFIARQLEGGTASADAVGVGIDEGNALLVDAKGRATLAQETAGAGSAFIVRAKSPAATCAAGKPLVYHGLDVSRLDTAGATYDFAARCGGNARYTLDIDGSASNPYTPKSPYDASGPAPSCP